MLRLSLASLILTLCLDAAEPRFVYTLPADSAVSMQRDIVYRTVAGQDLHFDLYRPASHMSGATLPVSIFMNGVGSGDLRRWPQYTGWGRAVTGVGLAGVTFDSHEGGVTEDAEALIRYLQQHAAELHLDAGNIVLWACSSNVKAGLPLAMDPRQTAIKAAVIYYGSGEVKEIPPDLPVLMVRAGLDGVGLNHGIDQFVTRASAANSPLTFINIPAGHHGFDLVDDTETSRAAIARTLEFMKAQLQISTQREVRAGVAEASAAAAVYREDWNTAVRAYEALAAIRPEDSEVHRNFGNVLLGLDRFRAAIAEYERALQLGNTNRGWISYSAATASMKLGDTEGALKWIENLKDIAPMRRNLSSDPLFGPVKDNPRFRAIADLP